MRNERYPGRSSEAVKGGFKTVFSLQSKAENPKIQGLHVDGKDAQGRPVTTYRFFLTGKVPPELQRCAAPFVPSTHGSRNRTTIHGTQHDDNDTIAVQDNSQHVRCAGSDEGCATEQAVRDGIQPGGPECAEYHINLQCTPPCSVPCDQDTTPHADDGSITEEQLTSTKEPVIRDENSGRTTYIGWDEVAKSNYWGFQVQRMKANRRELRDKKQLSTELSNRSIQLEESQDHDRRQLEELEEKVKALHETMRRRDRETEHVDQEKVSASKEISDLEEKIGGLAKEFELHYEEDD